MSVSRGSTKNTNLDNSNILSKINRKSRFNFLSCFSYQGLCFLIFLIFIALIIYLLICLTKTGLVNVPILSKIVYHEPVPIEVVSPASGFSWENKVDLKNLAEGEVTYTLTQEELTALVDDNEKFTRAQMAIADLNAELFAETKILSRDAFISVKFIPKVKSNQLDFKIVSAQIGDLKLPLLIANFTKTLFLESFKQQLSVLNKIKITKVDLKKGELVLTARPL